MSEPKATPLSGKEHRPPFYRYCRDSGMGLLAVSLFQVRQNISHSLHPLDVRIGNLNIEFILQFAKKLNQRKGGEIDFLFAQAGFGSYDKIRNIRYTVENLLNSFKHINSSCCQLLMDFSSAR